MNGFEFGKIKKRYVLKPIKNKIQKIVKFNKLTLLLIFSLTIISIIGGKELLSQFTNGIDPYTVQAESIVDSPTSADTLSKIEITNNINPSNQPNLGKINSNTFALDKRSYILDQYFLKNNSPLYGTGKIFVEKCDKYNAPKDCITAVAIARNETNLCKYGNSAQIFNCWGFGGSGPNRIKFSNFDESIDRVLKTLTISYGNQYMINPSLMEKTFCGNTDECVGWGSDIKHFIVEIDNFSRTTGLGSLLEMR